MPTPPTSPTRLTVGQAVDLVGDAAIRRLYRAGFVVVDRLDCYGPDGRLRSLRAADIERLVARHSGLTREEARSLIREAAEGQDPAPEQQAAPEEPSASDDDGLRPRCPRDCFWPPDPEQDADPVRRNLWAAREHRALGEHEEQLAHELAAWAIKRRVAASYAPSMRHRAAVLRAHRDKQGAALCKAVARLLEAEGAA